MTLNENCRDVLLNYLVTQHRPYSANDIVQNLNNKYNRATVQKTLNELTLENKIREKTYGKQKVYSYVHLNQNGSSMSEAELSQLDMKIEEATSRLKELERVLKLTEMELNAVESQPTTENAFEQITDLEESIKKLNEEVKNLSESEGDITEEEKNRLVGVHEKFSRECKKRKNICTNIIHSVLENYPKKMNALLEEIGIEVGDNVFR